jgi:hypothetical protein
MQSARRRSSTHSELARYCFISLHGIGSDQFPPEINEKTRSRNVQIDPIHHFTLSLQRNDRQLVQRTVAARQTKVANDGL